jgi:hypothetical protein
MISILVLLVVCGVALYLVNTYVPMAQPFKIVINVCIVLALALYLLRAFGVWTGPMPRLKN